MTTPFKLPEDEIEQKKSLTQKIKDELGKYGFLTFILFAFAAWTSIIIWNVEKYIEKANRQSELNYKIGVLEGKMELILQDKLYCPK